MFGTRKMNLENAFDNICKELRLKSVKRMNKELSSEMWGTMKASDLVAFLQNHKCSLEEEFVLRNLQAIMPNGELDCVDVHIVCDLHTKITKNDLNAVHVVQIDIYDTSKGSIDSTCKKFIIRRGEAA